MKKILKKSKDKKDLFIIEGWLYEELEAAVKEVNSWGPGMRRENEK